MKTDPLRCVVLSRHSKPFDAASENGADGRDCSGVPWGCRRTCAGHAEHHAFGLCAGTVRRNIAGRSRNAGRRKRSVRTSGTRLPGVAQPSKRTSPVHTGQPPPTVRKWSWLESSNADQPPEGLEVLSPSPQFIFAQPGYPGCTRQSARRQAVKLRAGERQTPNIARSATPVHTPHSWSHGTRRN